MKKIAAVAASAVLAVSMLGFTACSDSNGVIKGNYTTPTEEEFNSAISAIDTDTAFGDEDSATGFEILSKLSTSLAMGSESISADLDMGYKLVLGEEDILGRGTVGLKMQSKVDGTREKEEYKANVYNDAAWAYAEITGIDSSPLKCKLELDYLTPSAVNTLDADMDLADFFAACATYKIELGLDTSNGVKIKASVTEDTVWALLADADLTEEAIAEVKEIVTFNTFKLDMYLAFDKDGLFSQASIDMNLNVGIDCDALEDMLGDMIGQIPGYTLGTLSGNMTFKLKGYFTVKAYTGTVTLPEGIENDATYIDMTGMIGGILG